MRYHTLSLVAGSMACNARCQFCVAKMTPTFGLGIKEPPVNWERFHQAAGLARQSGTKTVMITGNGEPTLFPKSIGQYLKALAHYQFEHVELQTNGIAIAEEKLVKQEDLEEWAQAGLKLVAVSVVHYQPEKNRQVFTPHRRSYIDLPRAIAAVKDAGIAVRLTCILAAGFIDSIDELSTFLAFARQNRVDQLTLTPVNKPEVSRDDLAYRWTADHHLQPEQTAEFESFLNLHGTLRRTMAHGAKVYDLDGQSVCLSNCLTKDKPGSSEHRNLIFFPNGRLSTSWEDENAELVFLQP